MTILNFITQDELDDLSEDPQIGFMELVNHAQRRFDEQTRALDSENESEWRQTEELRHSFMNVIVAAAKRLEIEPFVSMEVPRYDKFRDTDHRQFRADLDHYVTQLMLDNSRRSKRDSVAILPQSKDRIRSYVHGLRECIERANMTAAKREALLKKLSDFERELEKRRLNILAVTRTVLEVLALPGGVWATEDMVVKLTTNIVQTVAEMKAAEDETRQLPPIAPPKALSPPRVVEEKPKSGGGLGGNYAADLDDDVPF